jgi:hypothetical protein
MHTSIQRTSALAMMASVTQITSAVALAARTRRVNSGTTSTFQSILMESVRSPRHAQERPLKYRRCAQATMTVQALHAH